MDEDNGLILTTDYEMMSSLERFWFAGPNVRLRTSTVQGSPTTPPSAWRPVSWMMRIMNGCRRRWQARSTPIRLVAGKQKYSPRITACNRPGEGEDKTRTSTIASGC